MEEKAIQDLANLSEKVEKLTAEVEQLKDRVIKIEQTKPATPKPKLNPETKAVPPVGEKVLWKKIGGGSLRLGGGRIIKPNQTFMATVEELPKIAVKNRHVIPVDGEVPQKKEEPVIPVDGFELKEKRAGWYDVVNRQSGKPVNEKNLRKTEAEKLLADLS